MLSITYKFFLKLLLIPQFRCGMNNSSSWCIGRHIPSKWVLNYSLWLPVVITYVDNYPFSLYNAEDNLLSTLLGSNYSFFFGVGRSFFFILCFIQGFSPSLNVTENCCLFRRSLAKVKQNQKLYPLLLIVISSFFAPIS